MLHAPLCHSDFIRSHQYAPQQAIANKNWIHLLKQLSKDLCQHHGNFLEDEEDREDDRNYLNEMTEWQKKNKQKHKPVP